MTAQATVVVPCFNDGDFLLEAVASVESVGREWPLELVIVDDGSADPGTLRVVGEMERKGHRVIRQANAGLGAARNAGFRVATTDFVIPLDADNRLMRGMVEVGLRRAMATPGVGVVYGNAEYFGGKTGLWRMPEFSLRRLVWENCMDACAVIRREAWQSVGGYDEGMPVAGLEDWDLWLRLVMAGWQFEHSGSVQFEYRVRKDSMLSRTNRHLPELFDYILAKPELRLMSGWRRCEDRCRMHGYAIRHGRLWRIPGWLGAAMERKQAEGILVKEVDAARAGLMGRLGR